MADVVRVISGIKSIGKSHLSWILLLVQIKEEKWIAKRIKHQLLYIIKYTCTPNFSGEYTLLNFKEILDGHVLGWKGSFIFWKKKIVIYAFFLALSPSPSEFQWELSSHFCVCDFFPALTCTSLFVILKRSWAFAHCNLVKEKKK